MVSCRAIAYLSARVAKESGNSWIWWFDRLRPDVYFGSVDRASCWENSYSGVRYKWGVESFWCLVCFGNSGFYQFYIGSGALSFHSCRASAQLPGRKSSGVFGRE